MEKVILRRGPLRFSAWHYGSKNNDIPLVLCLHGFPDNANSFRYQINDLLSAGYRVLTPVMRGYEPSSIPADNDLSVASIAGDVIAWLDQLDLSKVHLLGHDWGSTVAYVAASMAPDRFYSLTTVAVPHPGRFIREGLQNVPSQVFKSWYMLFNQIPGFSDAIVRRNEFAFLRFLWRQWSPKMVLSAQEWSDLRATFSRPGVLKAMLGYYRQNVSPLQLIGFKRSSISSALKIPVPNLAITGANDGCIDTQVFDFTILEADHPCGFRIERIPDAGHFLHQEQPERVNKLLIDWFNSTAQNDIGANK